MILISLKVWDFFYSRKVVQSASGLELKSLAVSSCFLVPFLVLSDDPF